MPTSASCRPEAAAGSQARSWPGGSLNLQGPDGSNERLLLQPPLCRVQRNEP